MPLRNLLWIAAIVATALLAVLVMRAPSPRTGGGGSEFEPVSRAYDLIRDNYYPAAEQDRLQQAALRGMVESLDDYCTYVPPGKMAEFGQRIIGVARGLGLRLEKTPRGIQVVGALPGSPAQQAKLGRGDRLLAVDGAAVGGMELAEVEAMLAGKLGEKVNLVVWPLEGEVRHVELARAEFPVETVEGLYRDSDQRWQYTLDEHRGIAYVRVNEFCRETAEHLQRVLRQQSPMHALVLDLRDNPGGLLPAGVEVANLFLRDGIIVTVVNRGDQRQTYHAREDGTYPVFPMVVLTNARTASAAEIVAGALRMHARAVLVGTRTCGKGCVQSMYKLGKLGQVNLTTSEFLLAGSRAISRRPGSDAWGVDPHEQVVIEPATMESLSQVRCRAEFPPSQPATAPASMPAARPPIVRDLLRADPQLARALELLRREDEMQALLSRGAAEDKAWLAAESRQETPATNE